MNFKNLKDIKQYINKNSDWGDDAYSLLDNAIELINDLSDISEIKELFPETNIWNWKDRANKLLDKALKFVVDFKTVAIYKELFPETSTWNWKDRASKLLDKALEFVVDFKTVAIYKELFPETSTWNWKDRANKLLDKALEFVVDAKTVEIYKELFPETSTWNWKDRANKLLDKIGNKMVDFKIDDRMTVNTLKIKFKETFGVSLRVYKGNNAGRGARFADDKLQLGTISDEKGAIKAGSEFQVTETMTIAEFEKAFQETFDIAVQVSNADDSKLLDNNIKLIEAKNN
jgi:hypothetical protein